MKNLYERVLDLRNRISLDGDDTIYEEDYLLLDEVLDFIGSVEYDGDIKQQEKDYNATVDIYKELEIGIKFKKQEKLLELYRKIYHISPMKNETKESYWARVEYLDNKIKELENEKI